MGVAATLASDLVAALVDHVDPVDPAGLVAPAVLAGLAVMSPRLAVVHIIRRVELLVLYPVLRHQTVVHLLCLKGEYQIHVYGTPGILRLLIHVAFERKIELM